MFREALAGILLAISVLAALAAGFGDLPLVVPGLLQLCAGGLLWAVVPVGVRIQSLCLIMIGCCCLLFSTKPLTLTAAVSKNQQMIAMLAAIGLLRHIPLPRVVDELPHGSRALWQTLFGVHWFGAAINISALAIFANRLVKPDGRLGNFQGVMLARGFALAALWSPFFVAMGVAMTYSPGANYLNLMLWGVPLSQLILAGMTWQTIRQNPVEVDAFTGYPFRPAALVGPLLLAISVLIGHILAPVVSIVTLITFLAPCYVLLANRNNHPSRILSQYVLHDLPKMASEVVLFVSAGILGTGLSSLVTSHAVSMNVDHNHLLLAALGLALIIVASSIGIHPVVGITVVGGGLAAAKMSPDLLAMSFLLGWGLGVLINPISGIHLFLTGRYAFPARNAWRFNLRFVIVSYLAGCAWLAMFSFLA